MTKTLAKHSALSTQHSALSTQYSVLSTQYSVLSTQYPAPVTLRERSIRHVCTTIAMKAAVTGSGKGAGGWFPISSANIGYDHATHSQLDHALLLDFVNPDMGVSARVAVEMD